MTLQKENLTDADTVTRKAGQLFSVQALFSRKAASRMSLWLNKQLKCTLFGQFCHAAGTRGLASPDTVLLSVKHPFCMVCLSS